MRRVEIYPWYERFWHWLQFLVVFLLLVTGLVIHAPRTVPLLGFEVAARVHELLGVVMLLNAALALFYFVVTGLVRQFLPPKSPRDFFLLSVQQVRYYLYGIFRHEPHPMQRPGHRFNVLQQVTYLFILSIALPAQVVTGLLLWQAPYFKGLVAAIGGLGPLSMVHSAVAWTMAAFIVAHVYLTTTGHTPLGDIKKMVFGYEEVEDAPGPSDGGH